MGVATPLVIQFDSSMNGASLVLSGDLGNAVATWSRKRLSSDTVTLRPVSGAWNPGTRTLGVTANTRTGVPMDAEFVASFFVDASISNVISIGPATGSNIEQGRPITLTFDGPLDPRSLTLGGSLAAQQPTVEWNNDFTVLTIFPNPAWTVGNGQTLTVNGRNPPPLGNPFPTVSLEYQVMLIDDGVPPTVALSNVKNRTVLHSGFLIGTASDAVGLMSVEVSLDGLPFQVATLISPTTWKFKLPASQTARTTGYWENSRHYVVARARDGRGNMTTTNLATFQIGVNHDINGDGYADVATTDRNAGAAYVFYGSAAGVPSGKAGDAATIITGPTGPDGNDISALGDLNGDGYADLVIAPSIYNTVISHLYVFYGSEGGIPSQPAAAARTIISANDYTFTALAIGDLDGNGYGDLAIGTQIRSGIGSIYVFPGTANGIGSGNITGAPSRIVLGTLSNNFGSPIVIGDVNGDTISDLSTGDFSSFSNTNTANSGAAYVFHGTRHGISTTPATTIFGPKRDATHYDFGSAQAMGDVNGDGYMDLAVGSVESNTVSVYLGSAGGIANTPAATLTGANGNADPTFGSRVAMGDVNGDGFADLAVDEPAGSSNNREATYIFLGSFAGIPSVSYTAAAATLLGPLVGGINHSLAFLDPNGDGYADLAIGVDSSQLPPRIISIFQGAAAGILNGDFSTAATTIQGVSSQFAIQAAR